MRLLIFFLLLLLLSPCLSSQRIDTSSTTKLVLLGTGTPNAEADRFGPSLAIVVRETSYIVDCGPGVVRRSSAAAQRGIKGLEPPLLNHLFITHLHSDHVLGYPDFILTPAVLERKGPLTVYGPKGTKYMTRHILKAYHEDIDIRTHGLEQGSIKAYQVNVTEINPGIIYQDTNITVKAFKVNHGSSKEAYGFRFETPDKIIVISGDCTYSQSIIENAKDCDILVHEVYSEEGYAKRPAKWKTYHAQFHTSSSQLAAIANVVKPKLLVLTHQLMWDSTEQKLLDEIQALYSGKIVSGHDLDTF
ncbi:MAG: MBL fold metallo-hydrolase [Saprospiraceae bacterium]